MAGKHRTDAPNLSRGTDTPRHSTDNGVDTAAIRVDRAADGRLLGFGVGRETGNGNYTR